MGDGVRNETVRNEVTVVGGNTVLTMHDQMQWAKAAASASILPDAYRNRPADILIAEGFGASMGLSPAESLYRISVIKGRPTMSAELIASQVRKAGHKLRISKDEQHVSVTATIVRADDPDYPFSVTRDMQWAHRMGLDQPDKKGNPSNYIKQPMTMLVWRAITAVAREACPEALYGAGYTPDEMHDMDDPVVAHVVDVESDPADGSVPVNGQIVATHEQRMRLAELMKQGGVNTGEKARIALKALIGVDSPNVHDVSDDDVLMLLDAPDLVVSRTREALSGETAKNAPAPAPDGEASDGE